MPGGPDELAAGVRPGDIIAGKYRVDRILGVGGMGVVVAAHHVQLDERCALKFLLPSAVTNPEAVTRFVREARAAVRIKSEHVARVSDVGTLENGSPYMVMEYLDGTDLDGWLRNRGALPIQQAVDFVLQASEAIADAHALGIVHRDLKPANLFCIERSDGTLSIKVLDFGISKVTTPGETSQGMTRTTAFLGSPFYMSPEQMKSTKDVDGRTDLWSLGVILFELLTGQVPFPAESPTELVFKVATEVAPSVRIMRPDVPPGLERVVATCLEANRDRRYQTVGDLALALREFASESARASVDRVVGTMRKAGLTGSGHSQSGQIAAAALFASSGAAPGNTTAAPAQTASAFGQTGTGSKSSGGMIAGAVLAGIVVLGVTIGGVLFLKQGNPVTPQAAAATPAVPSSAVPTSPVDSTPPGTQASPAAGVSPVASSEPHGSAASPLPLLPSAAPPPALARTSSPQPRGGSPLATPAVPATKKSSCNPPYVIDANGLRQYKPECL